MQIVKYEILQQTTIFFVKETLKKGKKIEESIVPV